MVAEIEVVAGVIRDDCGRILLAQRGEGCHLAGLWEFPGGKREIGESRWQALVRELEEELGIIASAGRPLIAAPFSYPGKTIRLDVWTIDVYSGTPWSREGQSLQWVELTDLHTMPMPAADKPVVAALQLPHQYLITPDLPLVQDSELIVPITQALRAGIRLIQLRLPRWPREDVARIVKPLRALAHEHRATLLVNGDIDLAISGAMDGVHLPAGIAALHDTRPLPPRMWLGVSCHDAGELAHAARIGADFATLSPVKATASHPETAAMGWQRFAQLAANATMPVFALGGMSLTDCENAISAGAQGIAAIRSLWPDGQPYVDRQVRAKSR